MELFKVYFLTGIITVIVAFYLQYQLLHKEINLKNYKLYIGILVATILNSINCMYITGFMKFMISTIILTFMCQYIMKETLPRAFSATVLEQILFFVAEFILLLVLVLSHVNLSDAFAQRALLSFISNFSIAFITLLLYKINKINLLLDNFMNYFDKIEGHKKYLFMLFFIVTLNVLLMTMYFDSSNKFIILVNIIFIIVYSGIVYLLFNEKTENIKFKNENKMLVDNLNEYEKMLDYQRIANHENKNQLAVIKGMIHKNNHKALDYINEIINEARPANESLFARTKRIPSGGLQGLVYQKMLVMQDKKIKVDLQVSKNIKELNLSTMNTKTNFDLCRIVGILLDNAIDEIDKLEQKEISISMFNDNGIFVIEIANCFKDMIDLEKIDEKGYTTKAKGHGYGLSLLKDIVSKNDSIANERMITKDVFIQIIKIKM